MAIGRRIRYYREKLDWTLEDISSRSGVEVGTISAIENRDSDRSKYFGDIAKAFGLTIEQLSDVEKDWLSESNVEPAPDIIMSKLLPISGEIQGGDNGYLDIQQFPAGYAEGCVAHPVRNPNCYALRVRGDSMHPRIKHREIIVIDPDHDLKEGDEVVVHLHDGRQMVKIFLYKREGEISLGSVNDKHPVINVKQSDIKMMHFVAAILPIGAVCKKA